MEPLAATRTTCARCGRAYASRSALFKHLQTSVCAGAELIASGRAAAANAALQIGYYHVSAPGVEDAGAVERIVAAALGVDRVHSRCAAPRGDMAIRALRAGAGAWADIVTWHDGEDPCGDGEDEAARCALWLARLNDKLAAKDGPLVVRALRRVPFPKEARTLVASEPASLRIEVVVPRVAVLEMVEKARWKRR